MKLVLWARELLLLGLFLLVVLWSGVGEAHPARWSPNNWDWYNMDCKGIYTSQAAALAAVGGGGGSPYCGVCGFGVLSGCVGNQAVSPWKIAGYVVTCPSDRQAGAGGRCECTSGNENPLTGVCEAAICQPFPATAPIEGQVWDTTDCRWEFQHCTPENIPLQPSPETGWYEEAARWCKYACVFKPITQPSGPQQWQATGGGCAGENEGDYDPPLPECEEGEWRNPANGQCEPPCLPGQTRDGAGVCQWDPCPPGETRNEEGHCVVDPTPDCPVGEHWSRGLGRCVPDDPACPPGTVRQPGGNCLAPPMPVDPTQSDENTTVTPNPDGSTTYVTTTVTTGAGGSSTTVTTTTVWPDGRRNSTVRTTGTGPLPPVQPVELDPGEGVEARTWAEIHAEFLERLQALAPLEAARGLSASFPSGGICPFGSLDLPWGDVSMSFVCDIWEEVGQVIREAMPAVWVIVGILILLSA